jgi:uncharacterized damage-inducible protein DinB
VELQYPDTTGTERELLTEYLDFYRATILRKVEGASDETLRARIVPSQTTLLGIVKHLAWVEAGWFQYIFAGREVEDPSTDDDPDADWRIEPHETAEQIIAFYKEACVESRAIAETAENLDAESVRGNRHSGKKYNLRRILIHMIEETARHAGHADILREVTDGQTGD